MALRVASPPHLHAVGCLVVLFLASATAWPAAGRVEDIPAPAEAKPQCPGISIATGGAHCLCPSSAPVCFGPSCVTGYYKSTKGIVQGFHVHCTTCGCHDGNVHTEGDVLHIHPASNPKDSLSKKDAAYWKTAGKPRVLVMTVATHREPFIELLEQSVENLGLKLHVAGLGETFMGYGWKLKKVREALLKFENDYDIVIFTDSFDSYLFTSIDEIVAKFTSFDHPMVVSAEVNIWPNPHLAEFMPPSSKTGHYPYPNSGGYIGYLGYILHLYTDVINIHHKSDCCDDQGELIKSIARDHDSIRIDHKAVIFQTLFGSAKNDVVIQNGRPFNKATGTQPCITHANGWDKEPLLQLVKGAGKLSDAEMAALQEKKATLNKQKILQSRESDINKRCANYNPNPSLEPERNLIEEYGLTSKMKVLKKQLEDQKQPWYQIEQQVFEVQEYRTHCPLLPEPVSHGVCSDFAVYLYPEAGGKPSNIHKEVRRLIAAGPYTTDDPTRACAFVPAVDVSCWCESCLGSISATVIEKTPAASVAVEDALKAQAYWQGGKNHLIFEFSDAPCIPFNVGQASVMKVGLSDFHHRDGLDVSMPLFSMVSFSAEERRLSVDQRKFLLTFRGTRSARSDAIRNQLPKLHNGEDIVLLCACRWYGNRGNKGYDEQCATAEEEFKKHTYTELAMNTKFALIVEGFGYHSFRLTEVMAAGAIPVIVVDHYTLPYSEILDWENFSIRVPEHRMMELPDILAAIPPEKLRKMQERVVFVFENFLRSLGYQVHTALEAYRIKQLPLEKREAARSKLLREGFSYKLPQDQVLTSQVVLDDSKFCNTPAHRQKESQDGAPM